MVENVLLTLSLISALLSLLVGGRFWRMMHRVGSLAPQPAPHRPARPELSTATPGSPVRVSVIVPARNEARDIEPALRSLLAQRNVQLQIVVINDHSTDRTGRIVDALARTDERITVIHDPQLVKGWFGKANAMQHGLNLATAELILFTDADVLHDCAGLESATRLMEQQQLDFLSLLPEFHCVSFWENVLLPHSFIAGSVHFLPRGVNDSGSPNAAAAGAFMLTKRSVLEQIGGLAPVRQEMLDDICLARVIKRSGFITQIRFAPELLSVRLFKSNTDAFWGPTKNILSAVDRLWKAFPLMLMPLAVYWIPLATIALGLLQSRWDLLGAGLLTYAIQAALILLVLPICRLRWRWALCFPLAAIPVLCCFTVALYHRIFAQSVAWRGRVLSMRD